MLIYGEASKFDYRSREEALVMSGIINRTQRSGTFMYTPLGKAFKDRIIELAKSEFKAINAPEIELAAVLQAAKLESQTYNRRCSKLISCEDVPFICDALNDAEEASAYLNCYSGVCWEKAYIDLSRRMTSSKLRYHSYGLLCLLYNTAPDTLCGIAFSILGNMFPGFSERLVIRANEDKDYSIRLILDGNDEYTLAHIHQHLKDNTSLAGLSIEKLVLTMVLHNVEFLERKVCLFRNALIIPNRVSYIFDDTYELVDLRRGAVNNKIILLNAIGVKELFLMTSTSSIKRL